MAQKVNILLIDDLDESEANQSVQFGLDGVNYVIDLSDKNAAKMRDALAKYIGVARREGKAPAGRKGGKGKADDSGVKPSEVRQWARDNGHDLPERGRIPADVREKYDAAHAA